MGYTDNYSIPFLYGAAYYAEYMPYERIDADFTLMKQIGINVIRIAESTWSTWEPEDGVFDFSILNRMLDKAEEYGLKVIVGTPTYAIPSWLAKKYPDILSTVKEGRILYGPRQIFDITNSDFRFHAERIIRRLMEEVSDRDCIIGYQVDNETRSAGAAGEKTQQLFVETMKAKYPDIADFNREFGLDYWSNRINRWEDFPDVRNTINGSLSAAYKRFLRDAVTEFLKWQADIIREYKRDDQFITHNFDFSWSNYSEGIQPEVCQIDAAKGLDVPGIDVYHLMQDKLDGATIAFGGAVGRSLNHGGKYLVLETEAQGRQGWLPYPGQSRLAAYSHIASGAGSVMYWHWHSIHNSFESYWKGILNHDLLPNRFTDEMSRLRSEQADIIDDIVLTRKCNKVAILVDNASLTALDTFPIGDGEPDELRLTYNQILREIYDTLYKMNIEADLIYKEDILRGAGAGTCGDEKTGADDSRSVGDASEKTASPEKYPLIIVPAMYSANEEVIAALRSYVADGGNLLMTYKSCFADDEIKIYSDAQPHNLTDVFGMTYGEFTTPVDVKADFSSFSMADVGAGTSDNSSSSAGSANPDGDSNGTCKYPVSKWMEMLRPGEAEVWSRYSHPFWGSYAAVTHNSYGKGTATYMGCHTEGKALEVLLRRVLSVADIDVPEAAFPVIIKTGINGSGRKVTYVFNYSSEAHSYVVREDMKVLLGMDTADGINSANSSFASAADSKTVTAGTTVTIAPWDVVILES